MILEIRLSRKLLVACSHLLSFTLWCTSIIHLVRLVLYKNYLLHVLHLVYVTCLLKFDLYPNRLLHTLQINSFSICRFILFIGNSITLMFWFVLNSFWCSTSLSSSTLIICSITTITRGRDSIWKMWTHMWWVGCEKAYK